jgi:hypothetical protein
MDKLQVVDYSGPYLELKRLTDQVWQAVLEQRFDDARALCDLAVVEARILKAQIAVQHPKEMNHD